MLNTVKAVIVNTARYLYRGVFEGFLVTGGLAFYAAFILNWPITPLFFAVFAVTTVATTLLGLYLRYRDDTRDGYLQKMNECTAEINDFYEQLRYYEDKLARESTLLKTPETSLNPHKAIAEKDLWMIGAAKDDLKRLISEQGELHRVRAEASGFVNRVHQRHLIALYKAFVTAYVFYGSFPLFVMLAVNAIIAPVWLAPLVIPVFIFAGLSFGFGLIKSYLEESRNVAEYDAAIEESTAISLDASALIARCEQFLSDDATKRQRKAIDAVYLLHGPFSGQKVFRKDGEKKKIKGFFLIKHAADNNHNFNNELRNKIPLLDKLAKPLGKRLPSPPFAFTMQNTWGKYIGSGLDNLAHSFYQWTLVNTVFDTIGKYLYAGITGALVPGGVALFLKFVLGVTFTPLLVNVFIGVIISTTVLSVLFRVFNNYRDRQRFQMENVSDAVKVLSVRAQEDLKALHQERASLYQCAEANASKQMPAFKVVSVAERKEMVSASRKLDVFSKYQKAMNTSFAAGNLLTSVIKWMGIIYNSITTGYSWYMGFPLFVFLTINTFIPIAIPLVVYATFGFGSVAGLFGVIKTFIDEIGASKQFDAMLQEGLTQSDAAQELVKHFEKPLYTKILEDGKCRKKNLDILNGQAVMGVDQDISMLAVEKNFSRIRFFVEPPGLNGGQVCYDDPQYDTSSGKLMAVR